MATMSAWRSTPAIIAGFLAALAIDNELNDGFIQRPSDVVAFILAHDSVAIPMLPTKEAR